MEPRLYTTFRPTRLQWNLGSTPRSDQHDYSGTLALHHVQTNTTTVEPWLYTTFRPTRLQWNPGSTPRSDHSGPRLYTTFRPTRLQWNPGSTPRSDHSGPRLYTTFRPTRLQWNPGSTPRSDHSGPRLYTTFRPTRLQWNPGSTPRSDHSGPRLYTTFRPTRLQWNPGSTPHQRDYSAWNLPNLGTLGTEKNVLLVRCPGFKGCNVHKQGDWDSEMCPVYRVVLTSKCPDAVTEYTLHMVVFTFLYNAMVTGSCHGKGLYYMASHT